MKRIRLEQLSYKQLLYLLVLWVLVLQHAVMKTRYSEKRKPSFSVSNIEAHLFASVGEFDGGSMVFVCLWFCSPSAVQVLVYTPVLLHIWLFTLINHVLCIFWQFPQISAVTWGIRLPYSPAIHSLNRPGGGAASSLNVIVINVGKAKAFHLLCK